MGPRNPNFDPAVRTSWNQCHCEDNQILIPTTIHESKLELKRLRYWENREKRISMLLEVITFDPTIGILISLVFWKLNIHGFQLEYRKTSKCAPKVGTKKCNMTNLPMSQWHQASAPGCPSGPPGGPWRCAVTQKAYQGL